MRSLRPQATFATLDQCRDPPPKGYQIFIVRSPIEGPADLRIQDYAIRGRLCLRLRCHRQPEKPTSYRPLAEYRLNFLLLLSMVVDFRFSTPLSEK